MKEKERTEGKKKKRGREETNRAMRETTENEKRITHS